MVGLVQNLGYLHINNLVYLSNLRQNKHFLIRHYSFYKLN